MIPSEEIVKGYLNMAGWTAVSACQDVLQITTSNNCYNKSVEMFAVFQHGERKRRHRDWM